MSESWCRNMDDTIEKLELLGYEKQKGKTWQKNNQLVSIVQSCERKLGYYRIKWRESWKNNKAIIYDYSQVGGPICIVPAEELFNSEFIKEKRKNISYENSQFWWTQPFPSSHELAQLILRYTDRWDIL